MTVPSNYVSYERHQTGFSNDHFEKSVIAVASIKESYRVVAEETTARYLR